MTERPLDRRIRELARGYHRPPPTPRDEIWSNIERALAATTEGAAEDREDVRSVTRARTARVGAEASSPWFAWASAAAAVLAGVLAVGIGIGRLTAPAGAPPSTPVPGSADEVAGAAEPERRADEEMVLAAAVRHLDRTEALLALVSADAGSGRVDPAVGRWARGLLLETRLLLDVPAGSDPAMGPLLEDLELILAQVAVLAGGDPADAARGREELRLIADGMQERDLLARIRTVLSRSGPAVL